MNNWKQHIESILSFIITIIWFGIDTRNSIAQFMVIACGLNISDIDVPVCKNSVESMNIKIDLFCFVQFCFHVIVIWIGYFQRPKNVTNNDSASCLAHDFVLNCLNILLHVWGVCLEWRSNPDILISTWSERGIVYMSVI